MSTIKTAIKGASWLALFRAFSQIISWGTTICVTRLLVPADYGLMEMATILTGYVALFSEMGLGSAIVQREKVQEDELSSLFWFLFFWGVVLAIVCVALAYPTAIIFNEPKTIPITQAAAIIYLAAVITIVPRYLLIRELSFKRVGFIDAAAVVISCFAMLVMAYNHAGVWTLIGGHIVREISKAVIMFMLISFRPRFHYQYSEVKPYLGFGINVAIGNSLDYITSKSDRFFGGRALGSTPLGQYSLALQIAQAPNEKIVSLINSVAYPVLARFQTEPEKSRIFFLRLIEAIAFLTLPLFLGVALVAEDLVIVVFGTKWLPMVIPLQALCLAQFFIAITTPLNLINISQGRPQWSLYLHIATVIILPIFFYLSAKQGLDYLALPWLTLYPLLRIIYAFFTLRKIEVKFVSYLEVLLNPIIACLLMAIFVEAFAFFNTNRLSHPAISLVTQIAAGGFGYMVYLAIIRKRILATLKEVWHL